MMILHFQAQTLRKKHDENHAPDSEERVADRVSDCVPERRHLTLTYVAHQPERSPGRTRTGDDAERQGIMEPEDVLGHEHAKHQWYRCRHSAPQEQPDTLGLQAINESRACGDSNDGDEDVQTDRIHEPD